MKRKVLHPQGNLNQLAGHVAKVVAEGKVLQPGPSAQSTLHSEAPRRTGATGETVAKRARIEPAFTGLGPEAKILNDTFNFEPMSGTLTKPSPLHSAYFHDSEDSQYEEMADAQVAVFYNAQMVFNSPDFTSNYCLGNGQWVFLNLSRRDKRRPTTQQSRQDVQLCNISILNMEQIAANASRLDPIIPKMSGARPSVAWQGPLLGAWTSCGTILARDSVFTRRTRGLPLVTCVTEGVHHNDVVNYWAACVPQPTVGNYGFWLHTRRPRNRELLKEYCDILSKMKRIDLDPKVSKSSCDEFLELAKRRNEIDCSLTKPDDYVWVIEPDTSMSKEHPPAFMYTGCNWDRQGVATPAVQFKDGLSGMGPPSAYLDLVSAIVYPRGDYIEDLQKALQNIPRCTVHLLGVH